METMNKDELPISPMLEKIRGFNHLISGNWQGTAEETGERVLEMGLADFYGTVDAAYDYYFGKLSIAALIEKEKNKAACIEIVKELQSTVTGKFEAAFDNSNFRSDEKCCENIVGLAKIVLDLKQTLGAGGFGEEVDLSSLDSCMNKLVAFYSQFPESAVFKRKALKQKILADYLKNVTTTTEAMEEVVEEEPQELNFSQKLEKVMVEMLDKNYNFGPMDEVAKGDGEEKTEISNKNFNRAADLLIQCLNEVDIRVREHFLPVLRRMFLLVKDHESAMRYVYQLKHFQKSVDGVPALRDFYKDFDSELTKILNGVCDYDSFNLANPCAKRLITRQVGFILTIAPRPAIRHILLFCVKAKPLVPTVLGILFGLRPFFELRVTPTQFESQEKELLIITLFRRFLNFETSVDMNNPQDRDTVEYILLALTRTQVKERAGIIPEKILPFFEATELLRDYIFDNLSRMIFPEFQLGLLNKVLQTHAGKEWVFFWKEIDFCTDKVKAEEKRSVDPFVLMSLLVDTYQRNSDSPRVQDQVVQVIRSLAKKLKADKFQISNSAFILNKMNVMDWCMKYYVCSSLSDLLGDYKPEIPRQLQESLSEEARERFTPFDGDVECDFAEEFVRSIFDLSMVSVELTLDLLNCRFEKLPSAISTAHLADALLNSVRKGSSTKTLQKLMPIIERLIGLLSVPAQQSFSDEWMDSTNRGMQKLSVTLVLAGAVKKHIIDHIEGQEKLSEKELGSEVSVILQTLCENVVNLLSKDFAPLKEKVFALNTDPSESVAEAEISAAMSDLSILWRRFAFFTETLASPPTAMSSAKKEIYEYVRCLSIKIFGRPFDAPDFSGPQSYSSFGAGTSSISIAQQNFGKGTGFQVFNGPSRRRPDQNFFGLNHKGSQGKPDTRRQSITSDENRFKNKESQNGTSSVNGDHKSKKSTPKSKGRKKGGRRSEGQDSGTNNSGDWRNGSGDVRNNE